MKIINECKLGDCRNENLINDIFGTVSEFAYQIEKNGNDFIYGAIHVVYDEPTDIHTFYERDLK